jgi:hypothetical protein
MLTHSNTKGRRKVLLSGLLAPLAVFLFGACSSQVADPGATSDPGSKVDTPDLPADQKDELNKLLAEFNATEDMTTAELLERYDVPFAEGVSYDPKTAAGMPLLQGSPLALNAAELQTLGQKGFVISEAKHFPTFVYGYEAIYAQDLPLFVSADSILFAVHRSYDEILKSVEVASLSRELTEMLSEMRSALSSGGASSLGATARADADVFVAVALSLLKGAPVAPAAGGDAALITRLVDGAKSHEGADSVVLFGVKRDVDFSQFKPRGHYTDSPELERYFQSMMWLGRIDFRMLETQPDHSQVFHRRQLEGALALRELMNAATTQRWERIDGAIQAFVGESDYMTMPELSGLLADLNVQSPDALANVSDADIVKAIVEGGYGTQRISSHIMVNGLGEATMPLSSSFALFGQRYVLDSHVFSNVVYDRVQKGKQFRMMPDPLDAAFAAMGHDQAAELLKPQLDQFSYAPDLHAMRVLADAHPPEFWSANLYNLWLTSLRELAPKAAEIADPKAAGLPSVAATEAWGRRLLNTQLASWAELRHDTILYAKQSYTGGTTCEFPDAYVDPYPGFYQKIADLAAKGSEVVSTLDLSSTEQPWLAESIPAYFNKLYQVAMTLKEMAEHERTGAPFTPEQMEFINHAVVIQWGCGSADGADGWYPELFFSNYNSVTLDPTIADVHTQPMDENGNTVGRVLHVGTGMPRLMVMTADTCTGPRAYVGLASSYFERVTENFERLDDPTWSADITAATPADVPWMKDIVVR